jgi:hypothetical protein
MEGLDSPRLGALVTLLGLEVERVSTSILTGAHFSKNTHVGY